MQFENPYGKNESAARCPRWYDYSHLTGGSAQQRDEKANLAQRDRMLTDYDLILLQFGMHTLWQESTIDVRCVKKNLRSG